MCKSLSGPYSNRITILPSPVGDKGISSSEGVWIPTEIAKHGCILTFSRVYWIWSANQSPVNDTIKH